jgi:hypothetical protein
MVKTLKTYIAESTKMYVYYIKVAIPLSSTQVNAIEQLMSNYQLVSFGKLTQIKDDKYDFFDIPDKNVHSIRIITTTPLSSYITNQLIRDTLNIQEKLIVVRGINEPVELEAELQQFKQESENEIKTNGFTFASMLDTNRLYDNAEQPNTLNVFGDEYNKNLLANLANIKADRKQTEFDAHSNLFSWIDMKKVKPGEPAQNTDDFNAKYNTPKPVTGKTKVIDNNNVLGADGNFSNGAVKNIKFYTDKQNKRKAIVKDNAILDSKG